MDTTVSPPGTRNRGDAVMLMSILVKVCVVCTQPEISNSKNKGKNIFLVIMFTYLIMAGFL